MDQYGTMGPLRRDIVEEMLNIEGCTFQQVADFFEVDYYRAYLFAKRERIEVRVPKSGRRIDPKKKQEAMKLLETTNMGVLAIAKLLGFRSRSSIYAWRNSLRKQKEREAVSEERNGLSFSEIRQKEQSRRCPEHGKVNVWPCVMCEAKRYQQQNRLKYVGQNG